MEVEVRFRPSGRSLHVAPGTNLLVAVRRAGLPIASACGADGVCARCGVQVLDGSDALSQETEREAAIKRDNRVDASLRLACRAQVNGPVEITASYW